MSTSRNTAGPHRPAPSAAPVPIVPDHLYPIDALRLWGMGDKSRAHAIREGLKVYRWSKFAFVRGADLIEFLTRRRDEAGDQAEGGQGR